MTSNLCLVIFLICVQMNSQTAQHLSPFLSKLSKPTNDFGLRFLEHLNRAGENKNILFSPLSTILAYGMLLEGATGQTEQQIKEVLQLTSVVNQTSEVAQASKMLLEDYKMIENGSSDRNFSLAIGNLAMINENFKLKEAFVQSLLTNYFAQATNEDFGNGTAVVNKVNSWVSEKTHGKITEILTNPPDPDTILMLVNTIYFKGQWAQPFRKEDTTDGTFTNSDGTKSNIKSMLLWNKTFKYANKQLKKIKILELPYDGKINMIFILPTGTNTLSNLVSTLNSTELNNLLNSVIPEELKSVMIPKFKLEDTHNLHEILSAMGMNLVFSDQAQLSNINERPKVKVSQSIQKAIIEVDEEGTVAAAVTLSAVIYLSAHYIPTEDFIIDRPFLFIIRDRLSGVNLFMGQMNKMPNIVSSTQSSISSTVGTPATNQTTNSTAL